MKRLVISALIFALFALGQTHKVTLTWTDTLNPAGTTYSVYRATGLCSGSPSYSKIATALTTKSYDDTTVIAGNYCFYVTAVATGVESGPSNTALAPVPAFAPSGLSITVQ